MNIFSSSPLNSKVLSSLSAKTSKDLKVIAPILKKFKSSEFKYKINIDWHGLSVNLHLQSDLFFNDVKDYFPENWLSSELNEQAIDVFIFDDQANSLTDSFWQDSDPNCHLHIEKNVEWACQRDFVARKKENQILAVCKNSISDGFFNLMRWLIPRYWLSNNNFLFHSAAVIDQNKNAHLCLGPSGAGKTTISKFLPHSQVLGDDMNLLTQDSCGQFFLTPSLLGQKYECNELFGAKYPLKNVFWLVQSSDNKIVINKEISFKLKICMSMVNIFWQELSIKELNNIHKLIADLNKNYSLRELHFSLDKEVWNHVFAQC